MQNQKVISRAIIKAEENERNRLAAELHDNVNQLLVSARLYIGLERKKQNTDAEFLDRADEQLGMAIEEIRELTRKLSTAMITDHGLLKSVADIQGNLQQLKNIRLTIRMDEKAVEKLSAEQVLMVYRIIQEQTNNILKYSGTKTAAVSLLEKKNNIELVICDKGIGFDKTEPKSNGIGFTNMLNRVKAFNGKMKLVTSPGKGCKLVITFPLSAI
ncbi:MAG: hypothetical protein KF741_13100 [Ferruginibacter sp.]|nr:hypothetical protein [Bacteroidota bacterium]MBX2920174.1 hypothetical protein [Ferruginibacter sp.]